MFCKFLTACLLAFPLAIQADCTADRIDERVQVTHVHDGDTVKLADGRKLRIIGIDTPELAGRSHAAEPLAAAARKQLQNGLTKNKGRLHLRFDKQHHDPYQRLLAHAFFPNGESVSEQLLRSGLATLLVLPPNIWRAECYKAAEMHARNRQANLWKLDSHQATAVDKLAETGFNVVHGYVKTTKLTQDAAYLYLRSDNVRNASGKTAGSTLRVKIANKDLHYFPEDFLQNIKGSNIEVRGIVHRPQSPDSPRHQFYLRLHHPVALQILSP